MRHPESLSDKIRDVKKKVSNKHLAYGGLLILSLIFSWPTLWVGLVISMCTIGIIELAKFALPYFTSIFTKLRTGIVKKHQQYRDLNKKAAVLRDQCTEIQTIQQEISSIYSASKSTLSDIKDTHDSTQSCLNSSEKDIEAASSSNQKVRGSISTIRTYREKTANILKALAKETQILSSPDNSKVGSPINREMKFKLFINKNSAPVTSDENTINYKVSHPE